MYSGSGAGFDDLVDDGGIVVGLSVADKPALLSALARQAATTTALPSTTILDRVRRRESLGSTGFGAGAAIPHARMNNLVGIHVVVARLAAALDYGAIDEAPVDIAVLLLSPEAAGADHLKALARISRTLRDPARLAAIRDAADADALRVAIGGVLLSPRRAA